MKKMVQCTMVALAAGLATPAVAQDLFIYPQQGQDSEQQMRDEFECERWATGQTGFDPRETPRATSAPPQQSGPGVGGSAVRGAGLGAIAGKITGSGGGRGAAAGAAVGGLIGGMRQSDQARAEDRWAQDQVRQYQQRRNQFNRALAVCLEGRGYTVR